MKNKSERESINYLFDRLFPLNRSIAGPGIEESLQIMAEFMPLHIFGVPSGAKVFDWITPQGWELRSAVLTGPDGNVICDAKDSNLHVVNYACPVDKVMSLDELQNFLHSLPELPNAIPYVTSYYEKNWGFCLSQEVRNKLTKGEYHAYIDSSHTDSRIPLAHCFLEGESKKEIFLSSYLCHPSLANNELSGPLVLFGLYKRIKGWKRRRHTFRFVLNPETIGSLCYLSLFGQELMDKMEAGLILTCLGGPDKLSYMKSRRGDGLADSLASFWNKSDPACLRLRQFDIDGSDERQYCSPGFNLPVGQFGRTIYGEYDGYHNSLDTKEFMDIDVIVKSIDQIEHFLIELDNISPCVNLSPYGEPQLGRRGLYPNINSPSTWGMQSSDTVFDGRKTLKRILMMLNSSDGINNMVDIAEKCECTIGELLPIRDLLVDHGLLAEKVFK